MAFWSVVGKRRPRMTNGSLDRSIFWAASATSSSVLMLARSRRVWEYLRPVYRRGAGAINGRLAKGVLSRWDKLKAVEATGTVTKVDAVGTSKAWAYKGDRTTVTVTTNAMVRVNLRLCGGTRILVVVVRVMPIVCVWVCPAAVWINESSLSSFLFATVQSIFWTADFWQNCLSTFARAVV